MFRGYSSFAWDQAGFLVLIEVGITEGIMLLYLSPCPCDWEGGYVI